MVWVGGNLEIIKFHTSVMGRDTFEYLLLLFKIDIAHLSDNKYQSRVPCISEDVSILQVKEQSESC